MKISPVRLLTCMCALVAPLLILVLAPALLHVPPPGLPNVHPGQLRSDLYDFAEGNRTKKGEYFDATNPLFCNFAYCYTLNVVYYDTLPFPGNWTDSEFAEFLDKFYSGDESLKVYSYRFIFSVPLIQYHHTYGFESLK